MKTRYIALIALGAMAFASCAQEIEITSLNEDKVVAYIDNSDTKTDYAGETQFSWVTGDAIRLLVYKVDGGNVDHYSNWADADGARTSFHGTFPDGVDYEAAGYALYPALTRSGSKNEGISVTLPNVYNLSADHPMNHIPLLGKADPQDDHLYRFRTATGVLKVTFSNMPAIAKYIVMVAPVPICGTFALNDDTVENGFQLADATGTAYIHLTLPTIAEGDTFTAYFPVPAGTLPAGVYFQIQDSSKAIFSTDETVSPITVVRNQLLNLTPKSPIAVPANEVDLSALLGTYGMHSIPGPYSTNNQPGDIVLEASDDAGKGNVMMTKFAGISGKQYGTFDGTNLIFPKDQIFGDNPYDDNATKPYVALDFYKGSVVDATFELVEPGVIKAVGADAMGLRTCTADDWTTYGGGWPWALCFGYIYAERDYNANLTYIPLEESNVTPIAVETEEGSVANLVDGSIKNYWHSPWSSAGTYDATYGIYIDIDLGEGNGVKDFDILFGLRGSYNDHPDHIQIYTSNDGSNWGSALADVSGIYATYLPSYNDPKWCNPVPCDGSAVSRYIRISILSTDGSNGNKSDLRVSGCTHMSDIQLWSR